MLFMASKRPKADPVLANMEDAVEVSDAETFNWSVKTENPGEEIAPIQTVTHTPVANVESSERMEIKAPEAAPKAVDSLEILQTNRTNPTLEDTQEEKILPLPQNMRHTVKAGETLYGIARLYRIGVMEIVSLNDLSLQDGIKPGQVLKLPSPERADQILSKAEKSAVDNQFLHEVRTSDTLYSIARQYNVTIKEIMEWNEKKDFSLTVGEKLKILRTQ
jgi:membrane-bound lytic murein transglycosylase D